MSLPTQWDPANLLQVYWRGHHDSSQCLGSTRGRGNARCRYGLPEENRLGIEVALAGLAKTPPANVTRVQLRHLGRLCLCETHRRYDEQLDELAARWETVLRRAADEIAAHAKRSGKAKTSSEPIVTVQTVTPEQTPDPEELAALKLQLRRAQKDLAQSSEDLTARIVQGEKISAQQRAKDAVVQQKMARMEALVEKLELEKTSAAETRQRLEANDAQLRRELAEVKGALDRRNQASDAEKAEVRTQLETAKSTLRATAANVSRTEASLRAEREVNESLRNQAVTAKDNLQRLQSQLAKDVEAAAQAAAAKGAEVAALKEELLAENKSRASADRQVEQLRVRLAALEADVAVRWTHRFRARVARLAKSLKVRGPRD